MAGYSWSLNNVPWTKDVQPLAIAQGERVELIFVNRTPMPHPMHNHPGFNHPHGMGSPHPAHHHGF